MFAADAKKWEQKVRKEAARAKRRVEGGGVKINVAAAAAGSKAAPAPAPLVSSQPSDGASQG